jgi:hypothetical protein
MNEGDKATKPVLLLLLLDVALRRLWCEEETPHGTSRVPTHRRFALLELHRQLVLELVGPQYLVAIP